MGVPAAWYALYKTEGSWAWALYPVVAFFAATRHRGIGNMLHEASHYSLVPGKRPNRLLGTMLAIVEYTDFELYQHEHFSHHRHTGDPRKDLDFNTRERFGFGDPVAGAGLRHTLRGLLLLHWPTYTRPTLWTRQDSAGAAVIRLAYVATLVASGWLFGWDWLLLCYGLPYFVCFQIIRYWSDAWDHAGVIHLDEDFYRSRNHIFGLGLLNKIVFPLNDQYHAIHHLFPAVPTRKLPKVHALLLEDSAYAAVGHSFGGMLVSAPPQISASDAQHAA